MTQQEWVPTPEPSGVRASGEGYDDGDFAELLARWPGRWSPRTARVAERLEGLAEGLSEVDLEEVLDEIEACP